jgi:hypothetical protein
MTSNRPMPAFAAHPRSRSTLSGYGRFAIWEIIIDALKIFL